MKSISILLLVVAVVVGESDAAEVPPKVSEITDAVHAFAKAIDENNLDAYCSLLASRDRPKAEKSLERMRRFPAVIETIVEALENDCMFILATDNVAEWYSKPWPYGLLKLPEESPDALYVSTVSLRRERAHDLWNKEGREDSKWLVSGSSAKKLSEVPNNYGYWRNKYPDAILYFAPDAPDWIRPPSLEDVEIVQRIESILRQCSDEEQAFNKRIQKICGGIEVFEEYFPADEEGRKALVKYWPRRKKEPLPLGEEAELVRRGLGGVGKKGNEHLARLKYLRPLITRYVSNHKGDGKALELLCKATYDLSLAHDVVYYGLSLRKGRAHEQVRKRFVELLLQNQSVQRVLWATQQNREKLIRYLDPYLLAEDREIVDRALVLDQALRGEGDYRKWLLEERAVKQREALGEEMGSVRQLLDEGSSGARRQMLAVMRRWGLSRALDRSFVDPLRLCAEDEDPEVRKLGGAFLSKTQTQEELSLPEALARFLRMAEDTDDGVRKQAAVKLGTHFIRRGGQQDPQAITAMLRLSRDPSHDVRRTVVYYGLSTVREMPSEIIDRLVELAGEETQEDARQRIIWGLRMSDNAASVLAERAKSGDKAAAAILADIDR